MGRTFSSRRGDDRNTGGGRAPVLRVIADAQEVDFGRLVALLSREAGKTLNDDVAEVRGPNPTLITDDLVRQNRIDAPRR
jgi:hypothetical protein